MTSSNDETPVHLYPPRAALETAFQVLRGARVPQVPDVVLGLQMELSRAEPDLGAAAALVAQDVALTGRVLKAINSPLFRCRTNIASVRQAVAMLGIRRIANLVTAESVCRMLELADGSARVIWDGIMAQARCTLAVAQRINAALAEEAYLFAIMQDVGCLVFTERHADYGSEWALRAISDPAALLDAEYKLLGVDHPTVGFLLAGNWRVPEPVALAIYHHHATPLELPDGRARDLVSISQLAHYLTALARDLQDSSEVLSYPEGALRELGLTDEDWSALCEEALEAAV